MKNKPYQTGMTLLEIMIALLIGVFLLGGVLQIFIGSKQTFRMQENLGRLQENARFAMDFLSKDIRMVDYKECIDPAFTLANPITGTNDDGTNDSDTVTISWSAASCATPANTTPVTTTIYSIQDGASGEPALFAKKDAADAQELVEGIEDVQVLYGEDLELASPPTTAGYGVANYYVTADDVTDMAKVVSVRIILTARTLDDNLTATADATAGDHRIRRNFTSTIALRNRLK